MSKLPDTRRNEDWEQIMSETRAWPAGRTDAPMRLLLTARDAAKALSLSERTLWGLTAPRGPIPSVRIGRAVRYDTRDLRAYIDGQKAP